MREFRLPHHSAFRRTITRAIILSIALPALASERTLLLRTFPTDVSWGEISIAEGPAVELVVRDKAVTFPFTVAVTCNERERHEDTSQVAGRAVVAPAKRRGAVYLAAQLPEGREAWKKVIEKLRARVGGLTPETFGTFADHFPSALTGPDALMDTTFVGEMCLTVDGQGDHTWEVRQTLDNKAGTSSADSTGFSDARPVCSKLVSALEGVAPSDVLSSRFEVRAQREESLAFEAVASAGSGPAPWPDGAGIAYGPAPEGATGYSSSGAGVGGGYSYEELRPARPGGPSETRTAYVLKAKAKDASIPLEALDADVLLTRWNWRVRDVTLGTEPGSSEVEGAGLDVAFLFTGAHERVADDEFARAVVSEFAASDRPPGVPLLLSVIGAHLRELGPDSLVAVFCDPAAPREATFCVAHACPHVTNAEQFCGALAARLDRP